MAGLCFVCLCRFEICVNGGNGIFPESDMPFDAILCIQFPILPLWTVRCEKTVFAYECTAFCHDSCSNLS